MDDDTRRPRRSNVLAIPETGEHRDDHETTTLVVAAAERGAHTGPFRLVDVEPSGPIRRSRTASEIERDVGLRFQVKMLWAAAGLALSLAGGGLVYMVRAAINGAFEYATERATMEYRLRAVETGREIDAKRIQALDEQLNPRGKP